MRRCIEGGERGDPGWRFVSLRKLVVQSGVVATSGECGADECEGSLWEGKKGVSE